MDWKRMERFRWMLSMPNTVVKDCKGCSGGLALFWKKGVQVSIISLSKYHIDALVWEENGVEWRLTGVYGEPKMEEKGKTWRLLRLLNKQYSKPWLCLGDFNEILFEYEKVGGQPKPMGCMQRFQKALEDCNLVDLGFVGDVFTWRNHHHRADRYIKERLDRAVACAEWRRLFPLVQVVNGDPRHSDHRPLIVECGDREPAELFRLRNISPKFEAKWLEEDECNERVLRAWSEAIKSGCTEMLEIQKNILGDLHDWDKSVLGELERRINNTKKELDRYRRARLSQENVNREHVLRFKLDRLLEQHNTYWKQRAHSLWLTKGDRNTKFFHACASERRRRNFIRVLKDEEGGVVEGRRLKHFITNHYKCLFSSCSGQRVTDVLQAVKRKVTSSMNEFLLKSFTGEEVEEALNGIGDLKAPGPDGIPSIFYKRFWALMGEQIKKEVLAVLNGMNMPQRWNETIIVLIPKVRNPEKLKDLRPISLCNVLYKLISKVLANRLKKVLPDVISPSQSAFVPGRLITDNVLLAYELTHYLKNRRHGNTGLAAIKLDMSKAYDRVEWTFLEKIMLKLGFASSWVDLIMKCVSTVSYRVRINGEYSEQFLPQRGLRQGDPLSPYLFILCAEGLSSLLKQAEERGDITGIRVCPGAVCVSHLFFVDDTLVLLKATETGARTLQEILDLYEEVSGQMINRDKTSILFSPNTSEKIQKSFLTELRITSLAINEKYLGLPVYVGKSKKSMFEYIKRKVWTQIRGWQEKLLSKAGKEIMIKAVAQAIPTYTMSCFDLTKGLCDEISSMIGRYWWSQQDKSNKIHWVAWEKLTRSKSRGGLGFRDLYTFNIAMLARQAWRILVFPDTLCAQVLKAKYFPGKSILEATARSGVSYTWRSILKGVGLLKEGIIWRIGNGCSVNIWRDPWIPRNYTRKIITPRRGSILHKVADLINPFTDSWDEQLIRDTFWEDDAKFILSMPTNSDTEDFPAWHPDPRGLFSVKSAYALGIRIRDQMKGTDASPSAENANGFDWKKLWRLNVANKVKLFIWQMAQDSLQVKVNIVKRGVNTDTICPEVRICLISQASIQDMLQKVLGYQAELQQKIVLLLWCWWSMRNKVNAGEKRKSAQEVVNDVLYHVQAWNNAHKSNASSSEHIRGWGFVIRDHTGHVVAAGAGLEEHLLNAQHSEAVSYLKGLEYAGSRGIQRIIVETDAASVALAMGDSDSDRSPLCTLFREIRARTMYDFVDLVPDFVLVLASRDLSGLSA
ncbi:hypothetical protein U9M48_007811 [Paspalum notatum var. saurae]|uniref:Reverse transcriptase domain-containing protein n=1 Tax=Paspalum notatum var. saurae TaxID=547442 RepID=A0AAQ3SNB8_PASNO